MRLVRIVRDLRQRGYPAPEYVGVGEPAAPSSPSSDACQASPCTGERGLQPAPGLFAEVLPSLLAAVDLQRDAGDLARPPWPAWLLGTIEAGGDGYCLHATMRQAPRTAALLGRLQSLARRNQWDEARTRDVVHFDMNPANILHAGGRLSGVVDWNIPFDGAGQGDRGFDVATLLFYTYDIEQTREALWERALELSGLAWTTVYLCHLSLRQVEWSRRHASAVLTTHASRPSPKLCWTTARREARDEVSDASCRYRDGRTAMQTIFGRGTRTPVNRITAQRSSVLRRHRRRLCPSPAVVSCPRTPCKRPSQGPGIPAAARCPAACSPGS